jgi:replication fork clamp-binding protein CrfC
MARELDPKGIRTIGVITKTDIMDKGTDARRMLESKEVPLRLGYVAVKNRSQHDINTKVRVKSALEEERLYFETHPVYGNMNEAFFGTGTLTARCSKVLFAHIKTLLPEIQKEIKIKIKEIDDRLGELGTPLPTDEKEKI